MIFILNVFRKENVQENLQNPASYRLAQAILNYDTNAKGMVEK